MDVCDTHRNDWDELNVSKEELQNLNECLKEEEFRKLLIEYAEEVTNPENRKIYQEEITELERERGIDVIFVNPEPGYVIKTSLNGETKCFINISKSNNVEKPSSHPSQEEGHRGLQWAIPYILSPPRNDLDKKNFRCTVYDVVFHPDTLYLTTKNPKFKEIVNNTALDGIEKNFKVKLDRKNLKFPKLHYKGTIESTVIRKKCNQPVKPNLDIEPEIYQKLMSSYDKAREKHKKKPEEPKPTRPTPKTKYLKKGLMTLTNEDNDHTIPKFMIKHQTDLDIQDFKNTKDSHIHAAIPKKLVIIIDLPLLRSANDAVLDVQERLVIVSSEAPAKYRLELPLSHPVDPNSGNAKFDTSKRKLTVILPVLRDSLHLFDLKDDSGVESDHGSPTSELVIEQNAENSGKNSININCKMPSTIDETENCRKNSSDTLINQIEYDSTRTKVNSLSCNNEEPFINPNIMYSLPHSTCSIFDSTLALTVHIKNVDSDSVRYKFLKNNCGIHIVLSSVGTGFFPIYYALCFKIKEDAFDQNTIIIEPWDNNVVFTITLKNIEGVEHYYVGLNEEFMECKDLPRKMSIEKNPQSSFNEKDKEEKIKILKNENENEAAHGILENFMGSDDDENHGQKEKMRERDRVRPASESSGDELGSSHGSRSRGILKYRRSSFSRSMSESSIDDTTGLMSSADLNYDSVHELNSESECCSLKKTVRFNDVVSRQLFRSNSSILGRRKKNQRKLRKKKQAHERRMSESENSETEERDKYKVNTSKNHEEISDMGDNNVKPIIHNHDKLSNQSKIEDQEYEISNSMKTELKNDLIFDLDM